MKLPIELKKISAYSLGSALVILAVVSPWFFKPGYLFFTDNVWGPNMKLDWTSSWFLLTLLVKIFSSIFSIAFLEKIFISGVLLLILLGGRFLVKTVASRAPSGLAFILSLFALFNPFVYDRALYGQFGVLAAYGCLLFIVSYLYQAWQTQNYKNLYSAAIFTGTSLMFSAHFIFLITPFYLIFLIASFKHKKLWLFLAVSILIILLLNANWLIAIRMKFSPIENFVEQGITSQDLSVFATSGKTPVETFFNVLLMSGFWGKDQFRYLNLTDMPGWQRSFLLLTPIIIYGVYLSFKKNRYLAICLLSVFTLAVILAIGIKSSFSGITSLFLYNHLPLYKGLREPQKWVAAIIPIYLFFLTTGAYQLSQRLKTNKALYGAFLAILIIMGAPSLLWGFNRQAIPTEYPDDWAQVDKLLVNNSTQSYGCSDNILFLPWHMYMGVDWAGKVIANPAPVYFRCPVISGTNMEWGGVYDNSLNPQGKIVDDWIRSKGQSGLPLVRYIILGKEVDYGSYYWINNLSSVKPLIETKTLFVYETSY